MDYDEHIEYLRQGIITLEAAIAAVEDAKKKIDKPMEFSVGPAAFYCELCGHMNFYEGTKNKLDDWAKEIHAGDVLECPTCLTSHEISKDQERIFHGG